MQILGVSQSWGFIKKHSVSTVSQAPAKTWGSKAILLESWRPNGRSDQTQAPALSLEDKWHTRSSSFK
jgi:hypothetical protein